jgi:hypothetical protein
VVSGLFTAKLLPMTPVPLDEIKRSLFVERVSPEKCYALAGLLNAAYDKNPLPNAHGQADRAAIMDYAVRGSWSLTKMKIELGQAHLPAEDIRMIINQMTLLE